MQYFSVLQASGVDAGRSGRHDVGPRADGQGPAVRRAPGLQKHLTACLCQVRDYADTYTQAHTHTDAHRHMPTHTHTRTYTDAHRYTHTHKHTS